MAPPTSRSTVYTPLPKRHHVDPPKLWSTVIIGSIVIHLVLFGLLRLLLMGRLQSFFSNATLIPVDLVTLAPGATSPVPENQLPVNAPSAATSRPTANRQPPATATLPPNQTTSQQIPTQNTESQEVPAVSPSPSVTQNRPVPNSPNPPRNPSPGVPATSNSPQNPSPSVPGNPGSPIPPQSPSPGVPGNPGSTPPQQGEGFLASAGQFSLTDNNQRDVVDPTQEGDAFATIAPGNKQAFSGEELRSLGITLDQPQVLQVRVWIETTGQATVSSTQVIQGNLSANAAQQLAKAIIEQWQFNPTKMEGIPVLREYDLALTITPTRN